MAGSEAAEKKVQELEDVIARSKSEASDTSKQAKIAEARLSGTQEALANAQEALKDSEGLIKSLEQQKASP